LIQLARIAARQAVPVPRAPRAASLTLGRRLERLGTAPRSLRSASGAPDRSAERRDNLPAAGPETEFLHCLAEKFVLGPKLVVGFDPADQLDELALRVRVDW
jgi:hypothetical protein